jgi:hypothetical protein
MDYLDLIQWPAMFVTAFASWLVASQTKHKRELGFWSFLVSNLLWLIWGIHDGAWALVALQLFLAGLNIRGVHKNERKAG